MNRSLFSLWLFSSLTAASSEGNLRGQKRGPEESHKEEFHRHLAESAAERFAYWTPERIKRATPLDLKLDAVSGEAYLSKAYTKRTKVGGAKNCYGIHYLY
ncbi:hypothetical protein ACHAWO_006629 [Cyclotella atomus]|uniref:Uncharacterized protein n=1 Tax=Cyclotella atomus TaxID=382360 RepID=A0ABD3P4E0_9STRA